MRRLLHVAMTRARERARARLPGPVQAFAEHQPVTSVVNAIRSLFADQPLGNDLWLALAGCLGLVAVAYFFAMSVYRSKIA